MLSSHKLTCLFSSVFFVAGVMVPTCSHAHLDMYGGVLGNVDIFTPERKVTEVAIINNAAVTTMNNNQDSKNGPGHRCISWNSI